MSSSPRAVAYIDLGALEENCRSIRQRLDPGTGLLGVVKADAYGHGALEVSKRLESIGIDYLGVATVDEGVDLRKGGIATPLLVMSGVFSWEEIEPVVRYDLTPVIYDDALLGRFAVLSKEFARPVRVHVKFDTGMGRLGFKPAEAQRVAAILADAPGLKTEGVMTHFPSPEVRDEYGLSQVRAFAKVVETFRAAGLDPAYTHMSSSGAIVTYPEAHFSLVRAGISLYGSHPSRSLEEVLPLRQVMKVVARIAFCREFPAGIPLSYGRTYRTPRETRIAYIPVGYSDGYPRSLSNKGRVLIRNRECSIVGRVCMDWTLADVTGIDGVESGDEAILLGEGASRGMRVSANEMAELAGTIPYEILCKISRRIKRIYL